MKQFRLLGVGIAAIILVGLTACSPSAVATQPASVIATEEVATAVAVETQAILPSAEVQVTETTAAEAPAIDVDALIREKIKSGHSIDRVYAADKTREEWNTTLNRMISYGAKISEEEKQIIIDYLLSRK